MIYKNLTAKGSRQRDLVIDVHIPEDEILDKVIIFAHGYKGFKDWGAWALLAEQLSVIGYAAVRFNFSYNGCTPEVPDDFLDLEAFGQNNYTTEVNDIHCLLDYISSFKPLTKRITSPEYVLIGHSRGGGMSVLAAAKDDRISSLITLASISDLDRRMPTGQELDKWKKDGVRYLLNGRTSQQMPHYIQLLEDYQQNKRELDISVAARSISVPWLIIHGTADKAVPLNEAEELKAANPSAILEIIEGANHVFGAKHPWSSTSLPADLKKVKNFISKFLS